MRRYEIWRASVKFEDSSEVKERPVLIWNNVAYSIVAYKMTSTDRTTDYGKQAKKPEEFEVKYWREAGLNKPTFIRLRKVLPLQSSDMIKKIGELDPRDQLRFDLALAGIG